LYGLETLSLTLREEYRLRVYKNKMLRRIFGLNRGEVTEAWIKLHNELHNLYHSPSIIRMTRSRVRSAGYVAPMREKRNAYRILVGKAEGKNH
jgi:hypothetical protein